MVHARPGFSTRTEPTAQASSRAGTARAWIENRGHPVLTQPAVAGLGDGAETWGNG
ncbi:hypothetical protein [Nonomuraea rosea]|uniref:hypothetical protein n=1 Tax=Nonomuraea rosea TaxID=638574 RepID=UPI0031EC2186